MGPLPAARRDHDFARLSAAASIPMPLFSVAFRQCLLVAIPRNIKDDTGRTPNHDEGPISGGQPMAAHGATRPSGVHRPRGMALPMLHSSGRGVRVRTHLKPDILKS